MGLIIHDAVAVTGWQDDDVKAARDKAIELGLIVTDIAHGAMNGYSSFMIAPDGSNEGWTCSNAYDEQREAWAQWAEDHQKIGANPIFHLEWAHVRYGDLAAYLKNAHYGDIDG